MSLIEIFVLAVALGIDCLVVSFSQGLVFTSKRIKNSLVLAITMGICQSLMPVLGYLGSETVSKYIEPYSKWFVFAIFMALGVKFIYEAFQEKEKEICCIGIKCLISMGIATSIDALASGVTLNLTDTPLVLSVMMVGLESIFISRYVKEIRWCAFFDCQSLKYVTFDPKSELTTLGTNSFANTKLSSFNFPSSFSSIEDDVSNSAPFYYVQTLTCVSYFGSNDISFSYLFYFISPLPVAHSSSNYQYKIGNIVPKKDDMKCPEKYYPFLHKERRTINYSFASKKNYLSSLIIILITKK